MCKSSSTCSICQIQTLPTSRGKRVLARSVEAYSRDICMQIWTISWANSPCLHRIKQRDTGENPTRWLSKWHTEISIQIAVCVGKALVAAVPPCTQPICISKRLETQRSD
eukprot:gnl/TRDRNA2_/TRDRNA2_212286_c0_seq1.p1 gnl/TRDRNA2_/TRDRNA2_212286_c0~~gnl/TRDRNA2_/TRDRNA2_212286_c0_seq1.p1  ORF type:complete len:110 (+),score=8.17 gnl/TRDRNA2_/TRDRNA2_212286_c0_seq1:130-459(+)